MARSARRYHGATSREVRPQETPHRHPRPASVSRRCSSPRRDTPRAGPFESASLLARALGWQPDPIWSAIRLARGRVLPNDRGPSLTRPELARTVRTIPVPVLGRPRRPVDPAAILAATNARTLESSVPASLPLRLLVGTDCLGLAREMQGASRTLVLLYHRSTILSIENNVDLRSRWSYTCSWIASSQGQL